MKNDMIMWNCARYIVANKALNFSHNSQTQHEINGLGSRVLTRLINLIGLRLTYLVLYLCIDMTQTRHTIFRVDDFLHDS